MVGTKFKKSLVGGLFLGLASILMLASPSLAVETRWGVLEGDWNVPANWTNGVPAAGLVVLNFGFQSLFYFGSHGAFRWRLNLVFNGFSLNGRWFFRWKKHAFQLGLGVRAGIRGG